MATFRSDGRRSFYQFSLRSLFIAVTGLAVVAFAVSSSPPGFGPMVVVALPFYALCVIFAAALRRPLFSAAAWIAMRLGVFVVFYIVGVLVGGEMGFSVVALSYSPDLPIMPLLAAFNRLEGHIHNKYLWHHLNENDIYHLWTLASKVLNATILGTSGILRLLWYGGCGYLVGRCALLRVVDRDKQRSQTGTDGF